MTAKRDGKSKPEKDRPKIEKETLRDLTLEHGGEEIRGGAAIATGRPCNQAGNQTDGCQS